MYNRRFSINSIFTNLHLSYSRGSVRSISTVQWLAVIIIDPNQCTIKGKGYWFRAQSASTPKPMHIERERIFIMSAERIDSSSKSNAHWKTYRQKYRKHLWGWSCPITHKYVSIRWYATPPILTRCTPNADCHYYSQTKLKLKHSGSILKGIAIAIF